MSNDDRSRRVWRLLERGWTSARALRDAIDQVRERVDEARVRLSDEVVSRIAGQQVRTQPDSTEPDPVRSEAPPPASAELQEELAEAADAVTTAAVAEEASKSAPVMERPDPIFAGRSRAGVSSSVGANGPPSSSDTPAVPQPRMMAADNDGDDGGVSMNVNGGIGNPLPVEGEIVALPRDAEWLFVYWDMDAEALAQARPVPGDRQFLLRVTQEPGTGLVHQSSAAVPSGRRYVRVPFADATYVAELWARVAGVEVLVGRSTPATTPPLLPKPPGATVMVVSSAPQRGVLNKAWDLARVPRVQPEAPKMVPQLPSIEAIELEAAPKPEAAPEPPETEVVEIVEWTVEGSESRLKKRKPAVVVPPDVPQERPEGHAVSERAGSEERLGGGSEGRLGGSEGRLGGSEGRLGGFEGRLGGSEGRLGGFEGRLGGSEGRLGGPEAPLFGEHGSEPRLAQPTIDRDRDR